MQDFDYKLRVRGVCLRRYTDNAGAASWLLESTQTPTSKN